MGNLLLNGHPDHDTARFFGRPTRMAGTIHVHSLGLPLGNRDGLTLFRLARCFLTCVSQHSDNVLPAFITDGSCQVSKGDPVLIV